MNDLIDSVVGWVVGAALVFVVAILVLLPFVAYHGATRDGDMMRQCINDGKPEYECYSMIYKRVSR